MAVERSALNETFILTPEFLNQSSGHAYEEGKELRARGQGDKTLAPEHNAVGTQLTAAMVTCTRQPT